MRLTTKGLIFFAVLAGATSSSLAGNLDPPGAPAGTMTTLEEINTAVEEVATVAASAEIAANSAGATAADAETAALAANATAGNAETAALAAQDARTPISSLPYVIDTSGSYFLTQNLSYATPDSNAITINASNVTVDLNGFTLTGPGKAEGTTGNAFTCTVTNVSIVNGVVTDFRGAGIKMTNDQNTLISDMRVVNNGGNGIHIGTNGIVRGNAVRDNGAIGIRVGFGAVVRDNSVRGNGTHGIFSSGQSLVVDNAVYDNADYGIYCTNSLIRGNLSTGNTTGNINAASNTLVDNHAP